MACGQSGKPMTKREGQTLLLFDSNQGYSRDISIRARPPPLPPSLSCPPNPQIVTLPPFSLPLSLSLCPCAPTNTNACILKKPAHVHTYRHVDVVMQNAHQNSTQHGCISCRYKPQMLNSTISSVSAQSNSHKNPEMVDHICDTAHINYSSIQSLPQDCK